MRFVQELRRRHSRPNLGRRIKQRWRRNTAVETYSVHRVCSRFQKNRASSEGVPCWMQLLWSRKSNMQVADTVGLTYDCLNTGLRRGSAFAPRHCVKLHTQTRASPGLGRFWKCSGTWPVIIDMNHTSHRTDFATGIGPLLLPLPQ